MEDAEPAGVSDVSDVSDVSTVFWGFVDAVNTLPHDELLASPLYAALCDAVGEDGRAPLALECGAAIGAAEVPEGVPLPEGVRYEPPGSLVFQDVNAMFLGVQAMLRAMLRAMRGRGGAAEVEAAGGALDRCITRMFSEVEVMGLVEKLGEGAAWV